MLPFDEMVYDNFKFFINDKVVIQKSFSRNHIVPKYVPSADDNQGYYFQGNSLMSIQKTEQKNERKVLEMRNITTYQFQGDAINK